MNTNLEAPGEKEGERKLSTVRWAQKPGADISVSLRVNSRSFVVQLKLTQNTTANRWTVRPARGQRIRIPLPGRPTHAGHERAGPSPQSSGGIMPLGAITWWMPKPNGDSVGSPLAGASPSASQWRIVAALGTQPTANCMIPASFGFWTIHQTQSGVLTTEHRDDHRWIGWNPCLSV
jgi:hypothetical protein